MQLSPPCDDLCPHLGQVVCWYIWLGSSTDLSNISDDSGGDSIGDWNDSGGYMSSGSLVSMVGVSVGSTPCDWAREQLPNGGDAAPGFFSKWKFMKLVEGWLSGILACVTMCV